MKHNVICIIFIIFLLFINCSISLAINTEKCDYYPTVCIPFILEKYLPQKIKDCRLTKQTKIVVMPLVPINSYGGVCESGTILSAANTIVPSLIESIIYKYVTVLERRQIDKILKELSFQYSDLSDIEKAKKVGKMLGADFIIIGEIEDDGCDYYCKSRCCPDYLNFRIVNIENGSVCSSLILNLDHFHDRILIK